MRIYLVNGNAYICCNNCKKMKLIYLLFVAAFLTSCGSSSEDELAEEIDSNYCACNELFFDEPYNHFFRFDRTEYFEGTCEDFYPEGQLKLTKNLVKGKNHGLQKKFFENGQVAEIKEFDMNFQVGEQINFSRTGDTVFYALYNRGIQEKVIIITPDYEQVK